MTKIKTDAMDEFVLGGKEDQSGSDHKQFQEEFKKPEEKPKFDKPSKSEPKVQKKREFGFRLTTEGISISKEMLPPITRRRMATYQLLSAEIKIDARVVSGPNHIEPPPFEMYPIYELFDRFETNLSKRRKQMVYSSDISVHDYVNTNAQQIDVTNNKRIQMPEFINGQVSIDASKDYMKYVWWELHPRNLSNKYRDKEKAPLFKRVDIEYHSPHIQLMQRDLALDAERHVVNLKSNELINLAAAFGIPSTTPISDMRLEMRLKASKDPKSVLFKSPDNKATTIMNIMSALDLGILDFDPDSQNYYLGDDKTPVWTCLVDSRPLEDFAAFLVSEDGADIRKEIEDLLHFWQ